MNLYSIDKRIDKLERKRNFNKDFIEVLDYCKKNPPSSGRFNLKVKAKIKIVIKYIFNNKFKKFVKPPFTDDNMKDLLEQEIKRIDKKIEIIKKKYNNELNCMKEKAIENKVVYDRYNICPICGGYNNVTAKDTIDNIICECKTKCNDCGHEDYWAYGCYESKKENNIYYE